MSKALMIASLMQLLSMNWRQSWQFLKQRRWIWVTLGMLLLFTIGLIYSHAAWHYRLQVFSRYLKIAYLPLLMSLFQAQDVRDRAYRFFLLGIALVVIFGLSRHFGVLPAADFLIPQRLPMNAIDSSFIVAIGGFTALQYYQHRATKNVYHTFLLLSLSLGAVVFLITFSIERTGYVLMFALIGLYFWQSYRLKGLLAMVVALPSMAAILFYSLPVFQQRLIELFSQMLQSGDSYHHQSIHLRVGFAKYSWQAIKQHPLFGYGTGSFREVYQQTGGPQLGDKLLSHPHNEYILMSFQFGFFGALLFIFWLIMQWIEAAKLPAFEKVMAQALVVSFSLLSLCNASLYVCAAGTAYILLLLVVFAAPMSSSRKKVVS